MSEAEGGKSPLGKCIFLLLRSAPQLLPLGNLICQFHHDAVISFLACFTRTLKERGRSAKASRNLG